MSNAPQGQSNSPSSNQGIAGKTDTTKAAPVADKSADAKKDASSSSTDSKPAQGDVKSKA